MACWESLMVTWGNFCLARVITVWNFRQLCLANVFDYRISISNCASVCVSPMRISPRNLFHFGFRRIVPFDLGHRCSIYVRCFTSFDFRRASYFRHGHSNFSYASYFVIIDTSTLVVLQFSWSVSHRPCSRFTSFHCWRIDCSPHSSTVCWPWSPVIPCRLWSSFIPCLLWSFSFSRLWILFFSRLSSLLFQQL